MLFRSVDITRAKAAHFGAEMVELTGVKLPDDVIAAVPRHVAKKYNVVPVAIQDGRVTVALADPSDLDAIDGLRHVLGMEVDTRVATKEDIENAISRYYGAKDDSVGKMIQDITEGDWSSDVCSSDLWTSRAPRRRISGRKWSS